MLFDAAAIHEERTLKKECNIPAQRRTVQSSCSNLIDVEPLGTAISCVVACHSHSRVVGFRILNNELLHVNEAALTKQVLGVLVPLGVTENESHMVDDWVWYINVYYWICFSHSVCSDGRCMSKDGCPGMI